jgi:hypothetical protein
LNEPQPSNRGEKLGISANLDEGAFLKKAMEVEEEQALLYSIVSGFT